eukprot:IDg10414t1
MCTVALLQTGDKGKLLPGDCEDIALSGLRPSLHTMDVIGSISSVISLAQITAETLNHFRHANAINEKGLIRSIDGVVNSAPNVVKTTTLPGSSSSPLSRAWQRTKNTVKTAFNISSITERLDTVKSKLQEAISDTSRIICLIDLEVIEELSNNVKGSASSSKADVFYIHFERPGIPQKVVLDYTTCAQNGEQVTAESRPMRTVITLSRGGEACDVSAVGCRGMGGISKTTALRGLCHADQVRVSI